MKNETGRTTELSKYSALLNFLIIYNSKEETHTHKSSSDAIKSEFVEDMSQVTMENICAYDIIVLNNDLYIPCIMQWDKQCSMQWIPC